MPQGAVFASGTRVSCPFLPAGLLFLRVSDPPSKINHNLSPSTTQPSTFLCPLCSAAFERARRGGQNRPGHVWRQHGRPEHLARRGGGAAP
eukprot:351978-Chlamydomonas_euryale.AAC.2